MRSRRLLAIAALSAMLLGCKGAGEDKSNSLDLSEGIFSSPELPALNVRTIQIPSANPLYTTYGDIHTREYEWLDFLPSKSHTYNFIIQYYEKTGYYEPVAEEFPEPFVGYDEEGAVEHRKSYRRCVCNNIYYLIFFSKQLSAGEHFYLRLRGENFYRTSYTLYNFDDLSGLLPYFDHLSHEYGSYSWKNYTSHRATCSECGHVDEQPHVISSDAKPDQWGYYTCSLCGGKATRGFTKEINEEAY